MADEQNVVVTGGVVGTLATTSYGPRTTNKNSPSSRPQSWTKRQILLQMDGSVSPTITADFRNNTRHALPAGCFIVGAVAHSKGGANIVLSVTDEDNNTLPIGSLAPAALSWAAVRDVDASTTKRSQITGTIGATETATVMIEYYQTEEGFNGVLNDPSRPVTSATI